MFEISTPKKKFDANKIKFGGSYPYVARGEKNNGIRGYINEDIKFLNPANTISFGQDTATMFYQTQEYFTGDKIKIFSFKKATLDRYKANFLIASMQKAFLSFSWGSTSFRVEVLENVKIFLPVYNPARHTEPLGEVSPSSQIKQRFFADAQNDKIKDTEGKNYTIAFDFMEKYIQELEQERIQELEAYLLVAGLKDTKLNEKEKEALRIWGGGGLKNSTSPLEKPCHNEPTFCHFKHCKKSHNANNKDTSLSAKVQYGNFKGISWQEFKIGELFDYERETRLVKEHRISGKYPLVTAGEQNQGVKEFISNTNQKIFKNAITIDMFCNSFVHIDEFCCDDNILVLNAKNDISHYCLKFISAIINKGKQKWGYGKQYRINSLESHTIPLPVYENSKIAFDFMESFIKAIQKQSIEAVAKFSEVKLKAYKNIVSKD